MRLNRTASLAWCAALVVAAGEALRAAEAPRTARVKFIELGWDIPNTALLRAQGEEMERTTPFDGVMFSVDFNVYGQVTDEDLCWFDNLAIYRVRR